MLSPADEGAGMRLLPDEILGGISKHMREGAELARGQGSPVVKISIPGILDEFADHPALLAGRWASGI
jgi:hypothetical protein